MIAVYAFDDCISVSTISLTLHRLPDKLRDALAGFETQDALSMLIMCNADAYAILPTTRDPTQIQNLISCWTVRVNKEPFTILSIQFRGQTNFTNSLQIKIVR